MEQKDYNEYITNILSNIPSIFNTHNTILIEWKKENWIDHFFNDFVSRIKKNLYIDIFKPKIIEVSSDDYSIDEIVTIVEGDIVNDLKKSLDTTENKKVLSMLSKVMKEEIKKVDLKEEQKSEIKNVLSTIEKKIEERTKWKNKQNKEENKDYLNILSLLPKFYIFVIKNFDWYFEEMFFETESIIDYINSKINTISEKTWAQIKIIGWINKAPSKNIITKTNCYHFSINNVITKDFVIKELKNEFLKVKKMKIFINFNFPYITNKSFYESIYNITQEIKISPFSLMVDIVKNKILTDKDNHILSNKDVHTYIKNIYNIDVKWLNQKEENTQKTIEEETFSLNDFLSNISETYYLNEERKEVIKGIYKVIKSNKILKENTLWNSLLLWPTGSWKTQLAKTISKALYWEENYIEINVNQILEDHHIDSLFWTAPWYIGYGKSIFWDKLPKFKNWCIILFDEIEKWNPKLFDAIMDMLDTWKIKLKNWTTLDISKCFIFFTSNIITKDEKMTIWFKTENENSTELKERKQQDIREKLLKDLFKPEFMSRIQNISFLDNYSKNDLENILELYIKQFSKKLWKKIKLKDQEKSFILEKTLKEKENVRGIEKSLKDIIIEKEMI